MSILTAASFAQPRTDPDTRCGPATAGLVGAAQVHVYVSRVTMCVRLEGDYLQSYVGKWRVEQASPIGKARMATSTAPPSYR